MIGLDTVIQDGHNNTLSSVPSFPDRLNVHVEAIPGPSVHVPLLTVERVREKPVARVGGEIIDSFKRTMMIVVGATQAGATQARAGTSTAERSKEGRKWKT